MCGNAQDAVPKPGNRRLGAKAEPRQIERPAGLANLFTRARPKEKYLRAALPVAEGAEVQALPRPTVR